MAARLFPQSLKLKAAVASGINRSNSLPFDLNKPPAEINECVVHPPDTQSGPLPDNNPPAQVPAPREDYAFFEPLERISDIMKHITDL